MALHKKAHDPQFENSHHPSKNKQNNGTENIIKSLSRNNSFSD
jgi:hypothetical protein